jgi:hypothetical protein
LATKSHTVPMLSRSANFTLASPSRPTTR